jgi:hypothetical protein
MTIALIALIVRDSAAVVEEQRKWREQKAGFDLFGFVLVAAFLGTLGRSCSIAPRGRLVWLVLYHLGCDRLRGRVCADDSVGDDPPQSDDRCDR